MLGQIDRVLAEVAALHADGKCPCDVCEAVREFADAPTIEVPYQTMRDLIQSGAR